MNIKYRFKIYDNIVCDDSKTLYQLEHFYSKYTYPFKKLTYNDKRKAYRIKSQWVSKRRLYKLIYSVEEDLSLSNSTPLESALQELRKLNK